MDNVNDSQSRRCQEVAGGQVPGHPAGEIRLRQTVGTRGVRSAALAGLFLGVGAAAAGLGLDAGAAGYVLGDSAADTTCCTSPDYLRGVLG